MLTSKLVPSFVKMPSTAIDKSTSSSTNSKSSSTTSSVTNSNIITAAQSPTSSTTKVPILRQHSAESIVSVAAVAAAVAAVSVAQHSSHSLSLQNNNSTVDYEKNLTLIDNIKIDDKKSENFTSESCYQNSNFNLSKDKQQTLNNVSIENIQIGKCSKNNGNFQRLDYVQNNKIFRSDGNSNFKDNNDEILMQYNCSERNNSTVSSSSAVTEIFDTLIRNENVPSEEEQKIEQKLVNNEEQKNLDHNQNNDSSGVVNSLTRSTSNVWQVVRDTMVHKFLTIRRSWIQLSGHQDCFREGPRPGTILKKLSEQEEQCFQKLSNDPLGDFVPKITSIHIDHDGQRFLEMQDLLSRFEKPASVMDIKMGCRTYREAELGLASKDLKLRADMYTKMIEIDKNEPTHEENQARAITKPRYMIWRETISSTASLGFRIEAMRVKDNPVDKNFKTIKSESQVLQALERFTLANIKTLEQYHQRLHAIRQALVKSQFFKTHELIGSSLLFVHDEESANIWLIDFAKTYTLPKDIQVTHSAQWQVGNHEDGYLIGIDNLISFFSNLCKKSKCSDNNNGIQSNDSIKAGSN